MESSEAVKMLHDRWRKEREDYESCHTPLHWHCWHSMIPETKADRKAGFRWRCHGCPAKAKEVWLDFIGWQLNEKGCALFG